MPRPQSHERPYHHGDLRRVIVKAALEILRETQSLEFSLRELARRAGVSHNAPYKHFADKRELLEAVSAAGFEMLTKRMANEIAGFHSPREQLFALLRAYIDHGVENPALYSLMFGGYLTGPKSWAARHRIGRRREDQGYARRRYHCGGRRTRYPAHLAQRTKDRRCGSGVLVPRAWTHAAAGGRARRPEEKI